MVAEVARAGGELPPAFVIAALEPRHAVHAASLHLAGQPGTFLSSLGPGVLTALYTALPLTRAGFGWVALDGDAAPRGFVAATVGVGRLFVEIGTTRLGTLLPPLLAQLARHPALLGRTAQTLLYPLLVRNDTAARRSEQPAAELLAIMVEPAWRSRGIGAQLLAQLLDDCRARGVRTLEVTVDANNDGARRFYHRHGFGAARAFVLYGRPMLHLRRAV